MKTPTFIERKDSYILWSFGNYQYQIEKTTGKTTKVNFTATIEEARKKLERVVQLNNNFLSKLTIN